ncbi:MAG: type I DNA topoisomerase [Alphaproteobacteria bacterium]|nr:type I DNA topoisomerase [Alphaproteobacteria bacterium]
MSTKNTRIVIVESPAKAATIERYLGDGWEVLASYGHVRDLIPKDGSVNPDNNFAMAWETHNEKQVRVISKSLSNADELWLATDPDREGEAISWHIIEELRERGTLKGRKWQRVSFNEITKEAITEAFNNPRDLDENLIQAYLARRALDYLFGFTVSPVLWRKLRGSRSAGRVQSVALRLVCEREEERELFTPVPYWLVEARFTHDSKAFIARPATWKDKKIAARGINDENTADAITAALKTPRKWRVTSIEKREERRRPKPPFTTSTLQQEASSRLGFTTQRTMRVAQSLYEAGHITYMRTDGANFARSATTAVRKAIASIYGDDYLHGEPRAWKSRARNAQEAHEAVRPTNITLDPEKARLKDEALALYRLIRQRALASQMSDARLERVTAVLEADGFEGTMRASGVSVVFPGYLRVWKERVENTPKKDGGGDGDSDKDSDGDGELPVLREGDTPTLEEAMNLRKETSPPSRYSEAALVRKMEELGIGRPSTYASILKVLRDREYVVMAGRSFVAHERGRVVNAFMKEFFRDYVEYDFTARLEDELDQVSDGKRDWKKTLSGFWDGFSEASNSLADLKVADVIDVLDRELGPHFFPSDPDNPDRDPRQCPSCGGRLGIKLGRSGGFIGCGNYPECQHTRSLEVVDGDAPALPRKLGTHPESGLEVQIKSGPFGPYIQEGEVDEADKKKKPRRAGLPKGEDPSSVDLERALQYLALPREIGEHGGEKVTAGIGRYGPWVRRGRSYASIPRDDHVLEIGLNRAVALIEAKGQRGGAQSGRLLGEHPDGGEVRVLEGRWGPYVKYKSISASIPGDRDPDTFPLDDAVALIAERAAKKGKGKGKAKAKTKTKRKATRKTKTKTKAKAKVKAKTKTKARAKATRKAASAKSETATATASAEVKSADDVKDGGE